MRVVIQVGHQPHGGAQGRDINEAEVNKMVAERLKPRSDKVVTYEFKRQVGPKLLELLKLLWKKPADIVVSLHCDAGNANLHKATVYFWTKDPKTLRATDSHWLAELLCTTARTAHVAETTEVRSAPYAREGNKAFVPGILKNTAKLAAVLFEMGYISDIHTEHAMMTEVWQKNAAAAIDAAVRTFVKGRR